MKLINLTGQILSIYDIRGERVDLVPDARYVGIVSVGEHRTIGDEAGHTFSLNVRHIHEVKGMPDASDGTIYVVPVDVAMALQEREDVVYHAEDVDVRLVDGATRRISHLRRISPRVTA